MGTSILLADKSVTIQKIVQLTFADEDVQITCFNDGQAALDAISQLRPDIILADIGLPVKNGYDVCQTVRTDPAFAALAHTPVILLAGIYETMDEDRARQVDERVKQVGANAFLSKPFDPQLLTSKVKELTEKPSAPPAVFAEAPVPIEEEFGEAPAPPESFKLEAPSSESDKTVMLPIPGVPGPSIFAEAPPFDGEVTPVPRIPVDVDAVKPQGEVVFEESEMDALPEELPSPEFSGRDEIEPEVEPAIEPPKESAPFAGFEEPMIEPPVEEPMALLPAPAHIAEPEVVTDAGDPFADVFAEPVAPTVWSPGAASEEESPFGLPEPPPAPPAPPEPVAAVEEAFNEPAVLEEPSLSLDESDREQVEEMMGAPAVAQPEFGEDTWSRAAKASEQDQQVEELFETAQPVEPVSVAEEAIELKADATSPGIKIPEEVALEIERAAQAPVEAEPIAAAPAGPAAVSEVSDELIEKIARRVVELLSDRVVAEIVWQVVPDLAEKMIRRELEKLHAGDE